VVTSALGNYCERVEYSFTYVSFVSFNAPYDPENTVAHIASHTHFCVFSTRQLTQDLLLPAAHLPDDGLGGAAIEGEGSRQQLVPHGPAGAETTVSSLFYFFYRTFSFQHQTARSQEMHACLTQNKSVQRQN